MRVGIIGAGAVGASCAKAMLLRGTCSDIVLLDVKPKRASGVATDLTHGAPACPATRIRAGSYEDLAGAWLVVITAGINELTGEATSRKEKLGRLLLLPHNAGVYADVVPQIVRVAPTVPILVVTDPPDPLADVALDLVRKSGGNNPVMSAGTFLDSNRFRIQIAARLSRDIEDMPRCSPASVQGMVLGEHGTSQVYVWSSARIAGDRVLDVVEREGLDVDRFRSEVEDAVKFANIEIIEGTGASQHGIGIVVARITEAVLRDEGLIEPLGCKQPEFGHVTLSLPAIIGRGGIQRVIRPTSLSGEEEAGLAASAEQITRALADLQAPLRPALRDVEIVPRGSSLARTSNPAQRS